jgi:hypothetical protein
MTPSPSHKYVGADIAGLVVGDGRDVSHSKLRVVISFFGLKYVRGLLLFSFELLSRRDWVLEHHLVQLGQLIRGPELESDVVSGPDACDLILFDHLSLDHVATEVHSFKGIGTNRKLVTTLRRSD